VEEGGREWVKRGVGGEKRGKDLIETELGVEWGEGEIEERNPGR
jgi:hypothetical protein